MKLIGIVIEEYGKLFKKQVFNFSDECKIEFCFEKRKLNIIENKDYIEGFYDKTIYNITPIVGINGVGKTTFLDFLYHYKSNNKENINNAKFFKVYKKENKFFVEKNGEFEFSNDSIEYLEDFTSQMKKTRVKNCSVIRDYSGGRYGGAVAVNVEFDRDEFPNIFKIYKYLNDRGIVGSKLKLELSSFYYGYKEDYPNYAKCIGVERIVYEILFNLLEEEEIANTIGKEVLDKIKNKKLSYKKIFNEINSVDLKKFKNIFINLKKLIEQLYKLKKDGKVEENKVDEENTIYLISTDKTLEDFEKFRMYYLEVKDLLYKEGIYGKIFHTIGLVMSKGESNLINTFSYINEAFERCRGEHWILVVDEIESGLHIEWARQLIDILVTFVKDTKEKVKSSNFPTLQIIYTTHSPFMLSDIKQGNILALEKENGYSKLVNINSTFAKNILEIMHQDLFIKNIYGSFAIKKIDEIIKNLNSEISEEIKDMKVVIDSIGEPLVRKKLQKMYYKKYHKIDVDLDVQTMIDKLKKRGYKVEKKK